MPSVALAPVAPAVPAKGPLLTKSIVDAYITAVIKLWQLQVIHSNSNTENLYGTAVCGFLEQHGQQYNKLNWASYKDRGSDRIQAGYSVDKWQYI